MRNNNPQTQTISDDSVDSIDDSGNFITTRTIVTQTMRTADQIQEESDNIDAQIANLQARKDEKTAMLSKVAVKTPEL